MSLRQQLKECLEPLFTALADGKPALALTQARSDQIDEKILELWAQAGLEQQYTLLAVGGYGRREVYPQSDIDLLIIHTGSTDGLSPFIQSLWDLGLDVGHAVRTWEECAEEAAKDVSTATAMMEGRVLIGDPGAAAQLKQCAKSQWSERDFFEAKRSEQVQRHTRRGDSDHNLEPDIKASPGGLRDLHTLLWLAGRLRGHSTLEDLNESNFLSEREYSLLHEAQEFLAAARFALHQASPRKQNRLLFEFQDSVAQTLGFDGDSPKERCENFMQRYYLMVLRVNEFNEVLLQQMAETLYAHDSPDVITLNKRFQIRDGLLEVAHDKVFEQSPQALMELFALLAEHPAIIGISAGTTRLVYRSRHLIDDKFRSDLRVISHFMEIMRRPQRLADILRRMRLYGVLSNYIPSFGNVMGLMQHDLFHIFTVDAHTMELVNYITSFWTGDLAEKYPLTTDVVQRVPKIELLILAGLFHDLGKGRGGDHSEIGAPEAEDFCRRHWLSNYDARLVAWLVRNHLLMSTTAQRKDISDPEVIREFAEKVGTVERLDYLLVLTVADISATNPELWNAWRQSLLRQLYHATRSALQTGLDEALPTLAEMIEDAKDSAATAMETARSELDPIWAFWGNSYFAQHSVNEIVWHTNSILASNEMPHVLINSDHTGTRVFVHCQDKRGLFSAICRVFERCHMSILDARLNTSLDGRALDSFIVVDESTRDAVTDSERLETLKSDLVDACSRPREIKPAGQSSTPRVKKHFNDPVRIQFMADESRNRTVMELIAPDRPGLLARVAQILEQHQLNLTLAKVATLGERVEDYFYLLDDQGRPLTDTEQMSQIRSDLTETLDQTE